MSTTHPRAHFRETPVSSPSKSPPRCVSDTRNTTKDARDMLAALLTCLSAIGSPLLLAAGAVGDVTSADRAHAFERVYSEGRWLNGADGARRCPSGWSDVGMGQGLAAVRAVRSVVDMFGIRSIADVPCGDGCFASAMLSDLRNRTGPTTTGAPAPEVAYLGVDIVRALVERNRATLGDARTHFAFGDVVSGASALPSADLVFSRQMLQHLCNDDALRFVRQVARSGARYALLTTFKTDEAFVNTDIPCASGGFRAQDLTKPPFSLPTPLALFDEHYPIDPRVSLGLWRVGALRHRLL